jgi:hypothetical protein
MALRALALTSILLLGACAGQKEATLPTKWARADGQPVNSGLLDIDTLNCKDRMQTPDKPPQGKPDKDAYVQAMVDDFLKCMRDRGYVQTKS